MLTQGLARPGAAADPRPRSRPVRCQAAVPDLRPATIGRPPRALAQSAALGRKVSDEFTVPLCRGHHREVHRCGDEPVWWLKVRINPMVKARATVVQSWGRLDAAKAQIEATTAQVNAAEIALNGVRDEARVGQPTTLDVLNAAGAGQCARRALVTAQHDRVVASYTLLAAVGGLSMPRLGLDVLIYDPQVHYQQVRDAWIGVRNPDGR